MAGMHTRDIVILCCYCVIFVALGVVIRWEYFDPGPPGEKSKRLRVIGYLTAAIAFTVLAVIHFYRGLAK
jgi:hypothetical protein